MASRAARRNRGKAQDTARRLPARHAPPGTVTLSGDQLAAVMTAASQTSRGQRAIPLPRPESWAQSPFPPGTPLVPAPINRVRPQTGRAEPRLFELPLSTNINISTAPYVPWRILEDAANIPLFRKCIERRKGVCDLDFVVTVDPKAVAREAALAGQHEKDVEAAMRDKYVADITRVTDWMQTPDRQNGLDWPLWSRMLFENRLTYDAVAIYPKQTMGGELFSLRVIDGSTIKPLLDEEGARPMPPFPAYQQILYGFPRGEFTADTAEDDAGNTIVPGLASDQMMYERTILRPKTPYGMSATEIALLDGIVWMRRMGWLLAEYTEGVTPAALLETGPEVDWDTVQWEEWLRGINDHLGGNTAERNKFQLFPPGVHVVEPDSIPEKYKPDYDMFLIKLVAGDYGLTATEVGFPEVGSLGASFHEGEEDVLNRVTRRPDADWLARVATKACVHYLRMPPVLQIQVLGLESEDEAADDAVALSRVQSGRTTLNEDRIRRGEPTYDFPEADMPLLQVGRGVVFLEGASETAPPGTLIGPAIAPPTAVPPGGVPGPGGRPEDGEEPGQQQDGQPAAKALRRAAADLGATASQAAALARSLTTDTDDGPAPGSVASELAAYRKWSKRGGPRGTFTCKAIARPDAPPEMAADSRVVFKEPDPKVRAGRGLAGTGTRTS